MPATHPEEAKNFRLLGHDASAFDPDGPLPPIPESNASQSGRARIIELAQGADEPFIEGPFFDHDVDIAARKCHLTAAQAGSLARCAGVKKVVPFHFSPRYLGRERELREEVQRAFSGG